MENSQYLVYNGELHKSYKFLISPQNRSFRYGDGFFETMKVIEGKVIFQDYHFERLFSALRAFQFDEPEYFTHEFILSQIQMLLSKNNMTKHAKVRFMVFRADGNLYEAENNEPYFLIQSYGLDESYVLNEKGLTTDIYKDARKTSDSFSVFKTNNYLPSVMAAIWFKKHNLDDAILTNNFDRIADATSSNVFIVKDGIVKTPLLSEGCVGGIVRRHLLQSMEQAGMRFEQSSLTAKDIQNADELFLTNTSFFIRWVQQCGKTKYTNEVSTKLFNDFVVPVLDGKYVGSLIK